MGFNSAFKGLSYYLPFPPFPKLYNIPYKTYAHTSIFVTMYGLTYMVRSWVQLHTADDQ
jgi:hypothetical protein